MNSAGGRASAVNDRSRVVLEVPSSLSAVDAMAVDVYRG
jgi:hypothetical protein